jgi:hypothetical protein
MDASYVEQAVQLLEKANAELQPELVSGPAAESLLAAYARAEKLAGYGVAALAARRADAGELARLTGTSIGKAKAVVATGRSLPASGELTAALAQGDISLDQAGEIAAAQESSPGAASELLEVARKESFHVLKAKARKAKLEAGQHQDLFCRQRAARFARSYGDELGMIHIHLALQPHLAVPITARAEAEAARLARGARGSRSPVRDSFEQHLADAYAGLLAGAGKGPSRRPELVVLVSHEVTQRGWKDVRQGEVCKIPGVGPVAAPVAKEIARDAFLSGVFYDGKDLRHFVRWTRNIPVEVLVALARRAAGLRWDLVCRLRQPLPHRVRPRTAPLQKGPHLQSQSPASLLALPSGQDQRGATGGQGEAARALTQAWAMARLTETKKSAGDAGHLF